MIFVRDSCAGALAIFHDKGKAEVTWTNSEEKTTPKSKFIVAPGYKFKL